MEIPNLHQIHQLKETKRVLNSEKKISNKQEIERPAEQPDTVGVDPDKKGKKDMVSPRVRLNLSENPKEKAKQMKEKQVFVHHEHIHLFKHTKTVFVLLGA